MNRLKTHLNPQIGALIQFSQIIDHIIWQTIRPRSDGQANNTGLFKNNFIIFPQLLNRCIGIRISLEISNIVGFGPFLMLPVSNRIKLCDEIVAAASCEIS